MAVGSSAFSAQLAAMLGLPFAFAFAFCAGIAAGTECVPRRVQPTERLQQPYVMVGVSSPPIPISRRGLFTSLQQQFINLRRGTPGPLPPPGDDMDEYWSPMERAGVEQRWLIPSLVL
jgi:alkanesulfonate monooxygenase SsuD/methylene tetrahydromethanopterin reductase-like flavin-dependent oxidoreductase (luciferase family)